MKYIRFASRLFRAEPLNFSLLIIMALLAAISGNYLAAVLFVILIAAEGRAMVLKAKVHALGLVAGVTVLAAVGGAFNE